MQIYGIVHEAKGKNGAKVNQKGRGNEAAVSQKGEDNYGLVYQRSRGHGASLRQAGPQQTEPFGSARRQMLTSRSTAKAMSGS